MAIPPTASTGRTDNDDEVVPEMPEPNPTNALMARMRAGEKRQRDAEKAAEDAEGLAALLHRDFNDATGDVMSAIDEVGASLHRKMQALRAFKGQEEIAKALPTESNRLNKIAKRNESDDDGDD